MKLRLAVFTVQTYDLTPAEAAAELQRLGYDGVEWRVTTLPDEIPANRNFWNGNVCAFDIGTIREQAGPLRSLSDKHGLALPTLGTYLDPGDPDSIEACLEAAAGIDVPMLRVGLPRWDHAESYDLALRRAVEVWDPVVDLARKHGVRVLAELHHGALTPSASAAIRFLANWSPENVGAIYDPGNMVNEGWEHPDLSIGALGPYLAHVHVKNARWMQVGEERGAARWRGEMCPMAEGRIYWPEVFAALNRGGYDGWFSTEDFGAGDTREKLARNITLLREWAEAV